MMPYILMRCPKCGDTQKYSLKMMNQILQYGGHKPTCKNDCKWDECETPNPWDNHVYLEIVDISQMRVDAELNANLIECGKLRGCYPLMEKTLYEFADFCRKVKEGQFEDKFKEVGLTLYGEEGVKLSEKYLKDIVWDDHVLVTFSRKFLDYCKNEYACRRVD